MHLPEVIFAEQTLPFLNYDVFLLGLGKAIEIMMITNPTSQPLMPPMLAL